MQVYNVDTSNTEKLLITHVLRLLSRCVFARSNQSEETYRLKETQQQNAQW